MSTHPTDALPLLILVLAPAALAGLVWLAVLALRLTRSLPDRNEDMVLTEGPPR